MTSPSSSVGEPAALAPQNLDAEESVLGALMLSPKAIAAVREVGLDAEHFYRHSHGLIFKAALALDERGEPTEAILLVAELAQRRQLEKAGGKVRLFELAALVPAAANVRHYARLVLEAARRRRFDRLGLELRQAAANGGVSAELGERLRAALSDAEPGPRLLEPLNLAELLVGEAPEVDWAWKPWVARGDTGLVVGDPGLGKSLLALGLADALRQGGDFLGEPCAKLRVGVFDFEMPIGEVRKRLRQFGVKAEDNDGLCYFHQPALSLVDPRGVDSLRELTNRYELDVVIVDSLRRAAPGLDENNSADVARFFAPLRELTASTNRTALVLHHARKRIGDNPTEAGQMVRGSGDLVASVDTLLYLRAKGSGAFILEHGKARRGFPHEPILVRIENEDERPESAIRLVNEGAVAMAEDKVEAALSKITAALRDAGPLEKQVLALRVGGEDRTFQRALKLGRDRELLAANANRKVGEKAIYALYEGVA